MSDFEKGFHEELEKIALTFDPDMTSQLMAGGQGLPPLEEAPQQPSVVLPLLKVMGTSMLKSYMTESPGGHRFASHNPRSILTQFRY